MSTFLKRTLILLSLVFFTSCAFNKRFFHPAKIQGDPSSEFSFSIDTVRTYVKMNPVNLQPLIMKKQDSFVQFHFNVESVKFKSSNGNMLNGWIMKPKHDTIKATILHFHGSSGFVYNQYEMIAPLLDFGYQVFTFDYSGFGFSEGKPTRKTVLEDAYSALHFVKEHPDFQDHKIVIYGQSLGGYLAAIVGSGKQSDIDGLVIEGAYTAHRDIATYQSPFWGRLVKKSESAVTALQKYKKPLLVIHSKDDKIVPIMFGKILFNEAKTSKTFLEIDQFHIGGLQFYAKEISEKINKLID